MIVISSEDSVMVSFDVFNTFPIINIVSDLEAVSGILENKETNFPPAEGIFEALKVCLECNNSAFNEKIWEMAQLWDHHSHPVLTVALLCLSLT